LTAVRRRPPEEAETYLGSWRGIPIVATDTWTTLPELLGPIPSFLPGATDPTLAIFPSWLPSAT
jgi:hypothetical protein